jgi:hypothetical protein
MRPKFEYFDFIAQREITPDGDIATHSHLIKRFLTNGFRRVSVAQRRAQRVSTLIFPSLFTF